MAKGSSSFLSGLADEVVSAETAAPPRPSTLLDRSNALSELTSGTREEKVHRWVDPASCRLWERHNRRYDLLTETTCADLIDGFKSQGKQEFPAIVRPLPADAEYDFEVICGARRHWTVSWLNANNYPDFKFLIEVRDLTDEEAFRLADIENRDRSDLSDYERASDYLSALDHYYGGRQDRMAERLEVSTTWLSRYLDLARLPKEVLEAYPDITAIKERHARDLKPLLKDTTSRKKVLACAKKLAIDAGDSPLDGQQVISALKAAATDKPPSKKHNAIRITTRNGAPLLEAKTSASGDVTIKILAGSGAEQDEIRDAIDAALKKTMA